MTITRQDIAAHLERSIRVNFLSGMKLYTPLRSAFARDVPSDGAFEDYADLGSAPWPRQNAGKMGASGAETSPAHAPIEGQLTEGGNVVGLGLEERSMRVYNLDWEIELSITHDAIDDDQSGDVEAWARGAAINFQKHMDFVCFDMLNNGASNKWGKAYDKNVFFYASHKDPGAEYQTVQSNVFSVGLSMDNFQTVFVAGSKMKDTRGQPMGLHHTLIIHPPELARTAANITKSREDPDTAKRAINPYAGMTTGLEAPGGWIDSTSWFAVDPSFPQKPINLQIRKPPTLRIWDQEEAAGGGIRHYKWHARYMGFYGDYRLCLKGN